MIKFFHLLYFIKLIETYIFNLTRGTFCAFVRKPVAATKLHNALLSILRVCSQRSNMFGLACAHFTVIPCILPNTLGGDILGDAPADMRHVTQLNHTKALFFHPLYFLAKNNDPLHKK